MNSLLRTMVFYCIWVAIVGLGMWAIIAFVTSTPNILDWPVFGRGVFVTVQLFIAGIFSAIAADIERQARCHADYVARLQESNETQ